MKLSSIKLWFGAHANQIVVAAIAVYFGIFSFFTIWKYQAFYYTAIDLAIFNQTFFNSLSGNWFGLTIHPPTYLGDHFSPLLLLLLPIYALTKTPESLLVLLVAVSALSAWPLYLIAKKIVGKNLAVGVAIAWLLNPVVQNATMFEFNFLSLAVFFLFWSFYYYQRKKFVPFLIFASLALLAREDVSLVIIMFGIIALAQKKSWRWVLAPIALGLIYFVGAILITKTFAPDNSYKFFIYYPWLKELTVKPWLPILYALRPNNIIYLLGLGLTVVFLPLLSPFFLLLGAVIAMQLLLGSGGGGQLLLETHYSSLLLPGLFIAAIYGLKKIIDPSQTPIIIKLVNRHRSLIIFIIILGTVYSSLMLGPLPGLWQRLKQAHRPNIQAQLLEPIQNDEAVAASYQFLAPLSSRKNIYSFNYIFLGKQQFLTNDYTLPSDTVWLALDFSDLITYQIQYGLNPYYQSQYQAAVLAWPKILEGFGLVSINDSYALFKRGAAPTFELIKIIDAAPNNTKNLVLTPDLTFLDYQKKAGQHQLFWQMTLPQTTSYRIEFELSQDNKVVYKKLYPFGYDLLLNAPSGQSTVQTNYWFNPDLRLAEGTYQLKLTLLEIISGGIEIDNIRSTKNVIDEKKVIGEILNTDFIVPLDTP